MQKNIYLELIDPDIQHYAESLTSPEDELLQKVSEYTYSQHAGHQMLSGHLQGKVLEMISCMICPRRILEIGTFTGYSALCLAKGLTDDGLLHTIEIKEAESVKAKTFFQQSIYADKIILHTGNALSIIPELVETWDLVFIDADKPAYIQYFNLVFPHVRKNGFILADNIFFHGHSLKENPDGNNAKGIKLFNEFAKNNPNIEKVVLTIRDGLYLMKKK